MGYDLPADGILLEGIGYDETRDIFYVSGVNDGGRIYRGRIGVEPLEVWLPGGVDGRTTGRGIDTDDRLYVVQNFLRRITELRLTGDWGSAMVESVTPTPADRTFTTAKFADGRLLLVDSRFGLAAPHTARDRVVELKLP